MRKFFLTVALAGLMFSCAKDDAFVDGANSKSEAIVYQPAPTTDNEAIVAGKLAYDPYTTESMLQAFNRLPESVRGEMTESDIKPSHYYIQFMPKNEHELSLIERDENLIYYQYPLDCEFEQQGTYYRDPEIPDGQPNYLYASVPVGQKLPQGVEYKVLKELYIPMEQPTTRAMSDDFKKALTAEAVHPFSVKTRGDFDNLGYVSPHGVMDVYDRSLRNYVPFPEGSKIKFRNGYTSVVATIRADGSFITDGVVKTPYTAQFDCEMTDFKLVGGTHDGSDYVEPYVNSMKSIQWNQPWSSAVWNARIDEKLDAALLKPTFYVLITKVAHRFYYGDIEGLHIPPTYPELDKKMKICVCNEEVKGPSKYQEEIQPGRIFIAWYNHEPEALFNKLSWSFIHASNYAESGASFIDWANSKQPDLMNCWAAGAAWEISKKVYPYATGYNIPVDDEARQKALLTGYSNLVMDLIDGQLNEGKYGLRYDAGLDKVAGYSLATIKVCYDNSFDIYDFRDELYARGTTNGRRYLNILFKGWYSDFDETLL